MKKVLLASTCAAAVSVLAAWTMSDPSFAQQNTGASQQNMGAQDNEHKTAPKSGETAKPNGAMKGSANENREPKANTAEQRENGENGKAGAMNRREPTTAEKKGEGEKNRMQSGQTSQPETNKTGQANRPERTQTGESNQKERMQTGESNQKERMQNGAANPKETTQTGQMKEKERARTGATEENRANERGTASKTGTSKENMQTGERRQQNPTEGRAAAEPQNRATGAAGSAGVGGAATVQGSVKLDARQASDFRSRLERHNDIARASVDFDARVGVAVPESVRLVAMPEDIIAEYPQFRGYDVVMVRDEIIIVDPRTRHVVGMVGGSTNAASAERRGLLHLTRQQDEIIRRNIHIEHPSEVEFDERIDARVPDTVLLEPIPGPVVAEVPEVRSYDYFVDHRNHVVIVDPDTHEVVGIVEE